ncbi:hypothetical protein [Bacillus sp. FSL K6-1000]|uniref:hypothetical protein n=1 Tax=Bacillus sp. FSL K6-1000 TaxID=2921458 RepID=UPI00315A96FF
MNEIIEAPILFNLPLNLGKGFKISEVITAAIIAGFVSIVIGIITIIIQNKHARRTSIVETISRQRIEWVNKMRDNFVEINDQMFVHSVKWTTYLRMLKKQESWNDNFNFFESITMLRKLRTNIALLINPSEKYAKELLNEITTVISLLREKEKYDPKLVLEHRKKIQKLQQIILKAEWSRTKKEIQKGKVLTDRKVDKIYNKKAKELDWN